MAQVAARNEQALSEAGEPATEMGPFGLVVGATIADAARTLGFDPTDCRGPILAPGVGAQGAGVHELRAVFGEQALTSGQVLATASRAVLGAGPQGLAAAARELTDTLSMVD